MEWTIKLEARNGWVEVEVIEVSRLKRRVMGLTVDEVGLTLAEGKDLLSELQRRVLQTQKKEYTMCARVCSECLTLRRDFIPVSFGASREARRRMRLANSRPNFGPPLPPDRVRARMATITSSRSDCRRWS